MPAIKKTAKKKTATKKPTPETPGVIEAEVIESKESPEVTPLRANVSVVRKETRSVALATMEDLMTFSKAIAKSGMFPGIEDEFQACSVIEYGREIGLKPIVSLQTMTVIKGRLCIFTQALAALAKESGIGIEIIKKDTKGCTVKLFKEGLGSHTESFTEDDAKRAGLLTKDNYMKYPEDMYYWRAISRGVKVFDPGLALGLSTAEEIEDMPIARGSMSDKKEAPEEKKETATIKKTKEKAKHPEAPEPGKPDKPDESGADTPPLPSPPPEEAKEPETKADHALEFEDAIKDIKMKLEKAEIKEPLFKKFLGTEFQPRRQDKSFCQTNQYGHWSFHLGKLEDLNLIIEHFDDFWVAEFRDSLTCEEASQKQSPDDEEEKVPF